MLRFAVLVFSSIVVLANADPPGGYYATKYDHINIDTILNTRRLVTYYAACLTDNGPCTPQGLEFKRILPEALRTNCLRCTEKQRIVTYRAIKRLKKQYPKVWKQLADLWDPTGAYVNTFEKSVESGDFSTPGTPPPVVISNRFDGSSDSDNTITTNNEPLTNSNSKPYPPAIPATTVKITTSKTTTTTTAATTAATAATTTTNRSLVSSSTITHNTVSVPATTNNKITTPSTTTSTTKKVTTTFRPSVGTDGLFNNIPQYPAVSVNVNTNFGVNGFVRRLGSIGTKVIETGSRLAGMLISTVQTVVRH